MFPFTTPHIEIRKVKMKGLLDSPIWLLFVAKTKKGRKFNTTSVSFNMFLESKGAFLGIQIQ